MLSLLGNFLRFILRVITHRYTTYIFFIVVTALNLTLSLVSIHFYNSPLAHSEEHNPVFYSLCSLHDVIPSPDWTLDYTNSNYVEIYGASITFSDSYTVNLSNWTMAQIEILQDIHIGVPFNLEVIPGPRPNTYNLIPQGNYAQITFTNVSGELVPSLVIWKINPSSQDCYSPLSIPIPEVPEA